MNINIKPTSSLNGTIIAPPSKSYSHRVFVAASLADGVSIIKNPLVSGDVEVTLKILSKLGISVSNVAGSDYIVKGLGGNFKEINNSLDCKNSGTSLRIFSTLALLIKSGLILTGTFLQKERPIIPLLETLEKLGGKHEIKSNKLVIKRSKNQCVDLELRGDISSQFFTALLMVVPLLECKKKDHVDLKVISPLKSLPYIKITLKVLKYFGINIQDHIDENRLGKFVIPLHQNYRAQRFKIPGDFSSIANIIVTGAISHQDSTISISNLDLTNPQGDKKIIEILSNMGAKIITNENQGVVIIEGNLIKNPLKGCEIDMQDIPDLFPILAVVGAFAKGKTTLYNALTVRYKESDRVKVMARELKKMGIKVEETQDSLTIFHCDHINGIMVNHENDHRIAMALTVANLNATNNSKIENIEVINDSYPSFIEDLINLGAKIEFE